MFRAEYLKGQADGLESLSPEELEQMEPPDDEINVPEIPSPKNSSNNVLEEAVWPGHIKKDNRDQKDLPYNKIEEKAEE